MSTESQVLQNSEALLLKEYELCQDDAHKIESPIWQTSAAIGLGTIGTFVLVANHPANQQPPMEIALLLGTFSLLMTLIWFLMARRWWSIQQSIYMRMQHLEEDLGFHKTRYLSYLDDPSHLSTTGLPKQRVEEFEIRRKRKRFGLPVHQTWGIQDSVLLIPILTGASWFFYIIWLIHNCRT